MIREILVWPDPLLKKVSLSVERVDDSVRRLLDDMSETMYAAEGLGLAAPQIGELRRCVVIDTSPRQEGQRLIHFVNPQIVRAEGATRSAEGCLSVPGEKEEVDRAAKVWVQALDYHGKPFELECEGLLAIAAQHEVDHLEGILFVDHLSSLKREVIRRHMKKLMAERESGSTKEIRKAPTHHSEL